MYALLAVLHYLVRQHILQLTDNPRALSRRAWWDFLFFLTQGIVTILIVPVAGVLLAYGFLMIPAAIGTLFSRRWVPALLVGWLCGFAACLLGIVYSYRTNSPYGPSLMLAMGLFFVVGFRVLRPMRHRHHLRRPPGRCRGRLLFSDHL